MEEDSKRIIMIDGRNSEWYEKAIFIMRTGSNTNFNNQIDFINEAEKIVTSYMTKATSSNRAKFNHKPKFNYIKTDDKKLNLILKTCLILSIVLLGITIYRLCL